MASTIVVPVLGTCTAFGLLGSGLPGLWRERKSGSLRSDPTPFVVMLVSCLWWVLYSSMIGDFWLFVGNAFGVIVGTINTATALRFTSDKQIARRLEIVFCVGIIIAMISMMVLASPFVIKDFEPRRQAMSAMCLGICLLMYSSPILQARRAVATGDVSQMSIPLTLAQLANGSLWTAYGIAQGDPTIYVANAAAIIVALGILGLKTVMGWHQTSVAPVQYEAVCLNAQQRVVKDAFMHGTAVVVRSLYQPDQFLFAPLTEESASGGDQCEGATITYVRGEARGTELQLVPADGANDDAQIAIRTADGRFLQLMKAAFDNCNSSGLQPNQFYVVATAVSDPGKEGYFLPVYGSPVENDSTPTGPCTSFHSFAEYSVAFWNPTHRVFLRLNEKGYIDGSATWNVFGYGPSASMPPGWTWERFILQPVIPGVAPKPLTEEEGPRRRTSSVSQRV